MNNNKALTSTKEATIPAALARPKNLMRSMEASKTVCLSTVIDHLETYDGQVLDYEQIEDLNAVTKAPKEVKDDHSDLNKHKD